MSMFILPVQPTPTTPWRPVVITDKQVVTKMVERNRNWLESLIWRGGWYTIKLSPTHDWPGKMSKEMEDWLKENTKSRVRERLQYEQFDILFRTEEDAMAFKLRWT